MRRDIGRPADFNWRRSRIRSTPAARRWRRQFSVDRVCSDAKEIVEDETIDVVSVCLPNDLHAPIISAALKAGKHVMCEMPPAGGERCKEDRRGRREVGQDASLRRLASLRRSRAGGAAGNRQRIYRGGPACARSWMRRRGTPAGTGWFTDKSHAGGGACSTWASPMLDLAWWLMGQPEPIAAFAVAATRLPADEASPAEHTSVERLGFSLLRFAGGRSLELAASWEINQPPKHQGTVCRVHAAEGAIDVYTPGGPMLFRKFDKNGHAKETPLKLPRIVHYAGMMRHFKRCIAGSEKPLIGPAEGVALMRMMDAIYKSAESWGRAFRWDEAHKTRMTKPETRIKSKIRRGGPE